ncbi:MAG: hypothetical protein ABL989_02060 [Gammaproteobacteria bacterium]
MDAFISDGRIVSAALGIVLLEMAALAGWFLRTGRGFAPAALLIKLAPGVCLMLALAGALRGAGSAWLALWLTAAGATHVLDLWRTWPR